MVLKTKKGCSAYLPSVNDVGCLW